MPTPIDVDFLNQVCVATIGDLVTLDIKRHLGKYDKFKMEGDLLYFKVRLFNLEGPTRLRGLQSYHDFPTTGHFRYNKVVTLELLSRDFL